jgi:hypothetical protein
LTWLQTWEYSLPSATMTEIKKNTGWFAIFRILFGCLVAFSSIRFFYNDWIDQLYIVPVFHFTFKGFEWVKALSPAGMYALFSLMIICGAAIALNKYYRAACVVFFITFTYIELIDVTYYLNHYYLVSLLAFIMIFYHSHDPSSTPHNQRVIFFLRLQVSMVYFFGGINKLETDWMLLAQPLQIWLHANSNLPLIGKMLAWKETAYIVAWAAVLFDVGVAFFLWFKKTRLVSYVALSAFHIATALLFHIGMFPWIMMTAALLFFNYSLPIKSLFTGVKKQLALAPLVIVAVWQLFFPLRHFLYPGNYLWTEQGFRFAWNIMLMEKNGVIEFGMKDASGNVQDVTEKEYLTPFQIKMVSTQPDLIMQFARYLKQKHPGTSAVFAECYVSLNGRRSQLYFDPELNLLTQPNEVYKNIRLHTAGN